MFIKPGLFRRYDPAGEQLPIVLDVSRSGREYPPDMRSPLPFTVLHDNVSMYVEDIWADAPKYGATMLYALFPHMYIDANRNELDIDPELVTGEWPVPLQPTVSKRGLGLLKSKSRYGEPVQERKLTYDEVEDRLNRFHRPYHAELTSLVERLRDKFGFVYHLTCHCMSAVGAPTHVDPGQPRADFCLGDLRGLGSEPTVMELMTKAIQAKGFSVTVNFPYDGGEIVRRYGSPGTGVSTVMVEINKSRFMNVNTFLRTDGFPAVQEAANSVLDALAESARARIARGS